MKPSLVLVLTMVLLAMLELAITATPDEVSEPCDAANHKTVDQSERGVGADLESSIERQPICDRNLTEGWYHFKLNGITAQIPTTCLRFGSCSGSVAMRIDLEDQALPAMEGKEISAWVCGSFEILGHWDCCVLRQRTTIRNCGKFYIYYLYPVDRCPVSYCVQDPKQSIPEELTIKQGDVVNVSIDTTTTIADVFAAPPPDDDVSPVIPLSPDSNSTTTSSTTDTLASRPLFDVSSPASDVLVDSDPTAPTTPEDNTQDETYVITDYMVEISDGTTRSVTTESEDTSSSLPDSPSHDKDETITYDHIRDDGLVTEPPGVTTSNVADVTDDTTIHVTDVPIEATSIKQKNGKPAATTTMPPTSTSSAVTPQTKVLATTTASITSRNTASSSIKLQTDHTTTPSSRPTSSVLTTARDNVTKQTNITNSTARPTTTSTTPSSITIPTSSLQPDDGRIVLKFLSEKDHLQDKENFTAAIQRKLSHVTTVLGLKVSLQNGSEPSVVLTDEPTLMDNYIYVTFRLEQDNVVVPADELLQLFRVLQSGDKNQQTWRQMNLELVDVYKAGEVPVKQWRPESSLFKENVILFIAIISVGSLCIVIIVVWLGWLRCRSRRNADRSSVLKANMSENQAVLSVENPATDAEIMKDEANLLKETQTDGTQLPPGAAPEDENGWIVPLDQVTTDNVAFETEDTRF